MSTLAVWRFHTSHGAERGGLALQELPHSERAVIHDAARVSWALGSQRPTTRLMPELAREEGLGEAFWGVLFGVIFFSPLLGAAVGSAPSGSSGSLAHVGIDDTFVNRIRDSVTPGTSALLVIGSDAMVDHVQDVLRVGPSDDVLTTRLQEGSLREVFVG